MNNFIEDETNPLKVVGAVATVHTGGDLVQSIVNADRINAAVLVSYLNDIRNAIRSRDAVAPYDVKAYGAKGDGTTDDTAAIQAAIDAAALGGKTVFFPALEQGKFYRCTGEINIGKNDTGQVYDGVRLVGGGQRGAILKWDAAFAGTCLRIAAPNGYRRFNCGVSNLYLWGQNDANRIIELNRVFECTVEGNEIYGSYAPTNYGCGVYLDATLSPGDGNYTAAVDISNNGFYGSKFGVYGATQVEIGVIVSKNFFVGISGPIAPPTWAVSTWYDEGDYVSDPSAGRIYVAMTSGHSGAGACPCIGVTSASPITDNEITWRYVNAGSATPMPHCCAVYTPGADAWQIFGNMDFEYWHSPIRLGGKSSVMMNRFEQTYFFDVWVDEGRTYHGGKTWLKGSLVQNDSGKTYLCVTGGADAGLASAGPTGTAADITDGSAHWKYIAGGTGERTKVIGNDHGAVAPYSPQAVPVRIPSVGVGRLQTCVLGVPEQLVECGDKDTFATGFAGHGPLWRLFNLNDEVTAALSMYLRSGSSPSISLFGETETARVFDLAAVGRPMKLGTATKTSFTGSYPLTFYSSSLPVASMDASGLKLLRVLTAAPASPALGMICVADRVTWDPLSRAAGNPYVVFYDGAAWKAMSGT